MTRPKGAVRILKLAAAQRQLDAAVRMTFADEDTLAITTVAHAAHGILRDVKRKRGHEVLAEEWRDNMLGVARALVRGELTDAEIDSFQQDAGLWSVICKLAERIKVLGTEKKISELRSAVEVHVPSPTEKRHWEEFSRAANFLKHADRDYDQSLGEEEVNRDALILAGCNLYLDLMGHLTPEMEVWCAHEFYVKNNLMLPKDVMPREIAVTLQSIPVSQRNAAATELIRILKGQDDLPKRSSEPT